MVYAVSAWRGLVKQGPAEVTLAKLGELFEHVSLGKTIQVISYDVKDVRHFQWCAFAAVET